MEQQPASNAAPSSPPRVLQVGPDRVTITDTEVVIEARHPLLDWDVREMNHVPVYVQEKKYFLVQKRRGEPPYATHYLLHPWGEFQETNAPHFHTYDAEAVRERDAHLRSAQVDDLGRAFLMPLYPLLGLLWSGMQKRLIRFGYVPHVITGFSVFVNFALIFGQAVFLLIFLNTSLRAGKVILGGFLRALANSDHISLGLFNVPVGALDILLTIGLILDVLVRYSRYMRDDQWAGGFFEWIIPRRKAKPVQVA